jgi:hypothetical protein
MDSDARVCPFCGQRPGVGTFCDACGRNLSALERLPTRAEWEIEPSPSPTAVSGTRSLADRCTAATESFLAAMRAVGDPGATRAPLSGGFGLRRTRRPRAWVLRPVGRENADPLHYEYEPGLLLTTDGRFHRLKSEVRGWGQARFPRYLDTAERDPIEMPVDERLIEELATVLRDNDVIAEPRPTTTTPGRAIQDPGPER